MGLIKLDGFETYGPDGTNDTDVSLIRRMSMRWDNVHGYSGSPAISPGISSNHPRGSGLNWEVTVPLGATWVSWHSGLENMVLGFAWRPNEVPYGSIIRCQYGSLQLLKLNNTYDGFITLTDYNAQEAGRSVKPLIKHRHWCYIELKVTFHRTAGTAVVRYNGSEIINVSNKDFGNSHEMNNLRLTYGGTDHGYQSFDDMYLIDQDTPGVTDFLGPIVVRSLKPNADTATADFTPNSGPDHFAVVDNDRADETDYLESSTVNDDDLFEYGNIPSEIVSLKAMSLETAIAVTGAEPKKATSLCKSGSAALQELDSLVTISNKWEQFDSILEDDPDTSSPWTISGLNAAQFGVRHKA